MKKNPRFFSTAQKKTGRGKTPPPPPPPFRPFTFRTSFESERKNCTIFTLFIFGCSINLKNGLEKG
jgi:hypothetical protein